MSVIVKNAGVQVRDTSGNITTNKTKSKEELGTVRVVYENIEYVFGPNESKTFADDGIGRAVATQDARLRVADTRDGHDPIFAGNTSISITQY